MSYKSKFVQMVACPGPNDTVFVGALDSDGNVWGHCQTEDGRTFWTRYSRARMNPDNGVIDWSMNQAGGKHGLAKEIVEGVRDQRTLPERGGGSERLP